jgi:hypothetical protein
MATSNYLYKLLDTISVRNNYVGIGTDIPAGPFHVQGKAYFDQITSTNSNINLNGVSLSNLDRIVVNTLTTSQSSSNINLSGKTLSNIGHLYVNEHAMVSGTLTANNLNIIGDYTILNTATSNTEQLYINNLGTGPALKVIQAGVGTEFSIAEFIDNETNLALKIADTGLIGINTDTPSERVHIYDTENLTLLVQSASNNLSQLKLQNSYGDLRIGPSASNTTDILSTANHPLRIGTNSNVIITLTPLGSVGIGSTLPAYQLDVGSFGVRDTFAIRNSGANRFTYGYAGVSYNSTGTHTIGLRLTWTNVTTDPIYSFRLSGKFHITSSAMSSSYRRFESIVSPADDVTNNRPSQISILELSDFSNGGFTNLSHTITRFAGNAVNVLISWNAHVQPAIAYLDLDIMANRALGEFTFTPLSS